MSSADPVAIVRKVKKHGLNTAIILTMSFFFEVDVPPWNLRESQIVHGKSIVDCHRGQSYERCDRVQNLSDTTMLAYVRLYIMNILQQREVTK